MATDLGILNRDEDNTCELSPHSLQTTPCRRENFEPRQVERASAPPNGGSLMTRRFKSRTRQHHRESTIRHHDYSTNQVTQMTSYCLLPN
ncbi:hypothetical protein TNCV_4868911 [Trichonephila clavipes]|nr:hypothetical protein TNCV_4868911 [Trichonephila clavipes]